MTSAPDPVSTARPKRALRIGVASVLLAALVVVVGGSAVAIAGAQSIDSPDRPAPTITAESTSVAPGEVIRVQGSNWGREGGLVSLQVCGNAGVNRSIDCDQAGTTAIGVRAGGGFYAALTVNPPPTACPCVIRVFNTDDTLESSTPINIEGMPVEPLRAPVGITRKVAVADVGITGTGPVSSWFGGEPERTLQFSVTNEGDVVLHHPSVVLAFGRDANGDGFIQPPDLGDLAPGQTVVARAAVPLPAMSAGSYTVTITVNPVGAQSVTTTASTTIIPWGWILIALLLLQGILLIFRNRYRERVARRMAEQEAADAAAAVTEPPSPVEAGVG